jgi:ABC-type transporter MlaC component
MIGKFFALLLGFFVICGNVLAATEENNVVKITYATDMLSRVYDEFDSKLTEKQQLRIATKILYDSLDIATIGRLTIGKYAKQFTASVSAEYYKEFAKLMEVWLYDKILILSQMPRKDIKVSKRIMQTNATDDDITIEMVLPNKQRANMVFRIRILDNNPPKIINVIIENIDILESYRMSFAEEIEQSGIAAIVPFIKQLRANYESVTKFKQ